MNRALTSIPMGDIALLDAVIHAMGDLANGRPVRGFADEDLARAEQLCAFLDEIDAEGLPDFGVRV